MNDLDNILQEYKNVLSSQVEFGVDNKRVQEVIPFLLKLQNEKERCYGSSWRKYGDVGAFLNMSRKYDRIENIMKRAMKEGTHILYDGSTDLTTETILDTIVDLSIYGLMWVSYMASEHPHMWENYLKFNGL